MNSGENIRKTRYSTSSQEVCPSKETESLQRKLAKKMEVRYVKEIKDRLKERMKSSYSFDCNQQLCPVIRERRELHNLRHHSPVNHGTDVQKRCKECRDQAVMVSPMFSRILLRNFIIPIQDDAKPVQTEVTMNDLDSMNIFQENSKCKATCPDANNNIPLQRFQTHDLSTKRDFYKQNLQNEILNWLHSIPMIYSMTLTPNQMAEDMVNNMTEKIYNHAVYIDDDNYEIKVKLEIEKCLNKLPIWLPGSRHDQVLFKNALEENLYGRMKELNKTFLGVTHSINENIMKLQSIDCYEKVIADWLQNVKFNNDKNTLIKQQTLKVLLNRLTPILNVPLHTTSYKLIIKGEIIDILDDLPIIMSNPKTRIINLNLLAEDLANRLLYVQYKRKIPKKSETNVLRQRASDILTMPVVNNSLNRLVIGNVKKRNAESEIRCSSFESVDSLRVRYSNDVNNKIWHILQNEGQIYENNLSHFSDTITNDLKNAIRDGMSYPNVSQIISVYSFPVTSTPKKSKPKSKFNQEETAYMDQLKALVRSWIDTLPKKFSENQFKETIIEDLAGGILDQEKIRQLSPASKSSNETKDTADLLVYRWLYKFADFNSKKVADPYINDLLQKIERLPVPKLTVPQGGTRQAMQNIKFQEERGYDETFVPQGIDVLEDQISIWINEQPSEIYIKQNKNDRSKMSHDLALQLQDRLRNKSPEDEIDNDIKEWLNKVVRPKEKEHIALLTQNLKEIVIKIPQDKTLEEKQQERHKYRADYREAKRKAANEQNQQIPQHLSNLGNIEGDPDLTIKAFIAKYLQHNDDTADPMARGAFSQVLKTELRKLSPTTRQEIYDNFEKSTPHEQFPSKKLNRELELIKIISDWLKTIPIKSSYNTTGNKDRVEFITDLARNIQEIENQRMADPNQMNYDSYLRSIISQSVRTYDLPILKRNKDHVPLMVDDLMLMIAPTLMSPSVSYANGNQSSTISDIQEQNVSEFIKEYIRINGQDIADDPVKLEVWTSRLLYEIKKIAQSGIDPATLTKAQVHTKFSEVPMPGEESLKRFSLQIQYIKDISEWMKNLPLLPTQDQPEVESRIMQMISNLSDKIVERGVKKQSDPNDTAADKNLENYIKAWISELPLDPRKEVVMPIVIKQLINRIDKIDEVESVNSFKSAIAEDESKVKDSLVCLKKKSKELKDPRAKTVEAIESWSNALPIYLEDKNATKNMQAAITRNLYQKIGELNVDPRIYNDDIVYKDLLVDEIDTQLENIPQNSDLQKNRSKLKNKLLDTILEQKNIIRQKSAGDSYKHKLETTIDASIPNPLHSRYVLDPGFEIYKNHLADMFILQNFDHSNDLVKDKYENRIKHQIDRYFGSAQNKNVFPLTKKQMYNELYSQLFKVEVPDEQLLIDEVEEVKTKCEIEAWFETLPLKEPNGLPELLEWDRILSTLAKRIHEIEITETKPDSKINKEITKWLSKLPLQSGHEGNIDHFVKILQNQLKATVDDRKYTPHDPDRDVKKRKGKSLKKQESKTKNKDTQNISQVPGPSTEGNKWASPVSKSTIKHCCTIATPYKKPADIIIEIVEDWCDSLPLQLNEKDAKIMKDDLSTKIIMKISELNIDPQIFNDNVIYSEFLDDELDKLLANIPLPCNFIQTKAARKHQLKEGINSVKPLIKREQERYYYREELNNTVDNILKEPQNPTSGQQMALDQIKDDIVENYILLYYHEGDDNARRVYKTKINDAVSKFMTEFKPTEEEYLNPLITYNRLYCELERIPVPNNTVLKDEAEEIKLKSEVEQFFNEKVPESDYLNTENKKLEAKMKNTLSKRLNDLEKSGHNATINNKMKSEIARSLDKINKVVSPKTISEFVERLERNMVDRRDLLVKPVEIPSSPQARELPNISVGVQYPNELPHPNGPKLISRLGPTRVKHDSVFEPDKWMTFSSFGSSIQSINPRVTNYEGFECGAVLSSTLAPQEPAVPVPYNFRCSRERQSIRNPHQISHKAIQVTPRAISSSSMSPCIQSPQTQPGQIPLLQEEPTVLSPQEITSESLFQQPPIFEPQPLISPLTVPSIESIDEHFRAPGSRVQTGGDHRPSDLRTISRQRSEVDDERCKCKKRKLRKGRARPFCMMSLEEYCDKCGRFGPIWYPMPLPGFLFY